MQAKDLAEKFSTKVLDAGVEKDRQKAISHENNGKRRDDVDHCRRAMTDNVMPFLRELAQQLPEGQFSFAPQIDGRDHHNILGVSFTIGDGPTTTISTAMGNVVVTHAGASGAKKGVSFVYSPDAEPYISNSGDLTREKIAKLVEMVMDNARQ